MARVSMRLENSKFEGGPSEDVGEVKNGGKPSYGD